MEEIEENRQRWHHQLASSPRRAILAFGFWTQGSRRIRVPALCWWSTSPCLAIGHWRQARLCSWYHGKRDVRRLPPTRQVKSYASHNWHGHRKRVLGDMVKSHPQYARLTIERRFCANPPQPCLRQRRVPAEIASV